MIRGPVAVMGEFFLESKVCSDWRGAHIQRHIWESCCESLSYPPLLKWRNSLSWISLGPVSPFESHNALDIALTIAWWKHLRRWHDLTIQVCKLAGLHIATPLKNCSLLWFGAHVHLLFGHNRKSEGNSCNRWNVCISTFEESVFTMKNCLVPVYEELFFYLLFTLMASTPNSAPR